MTTAVTGHCSQCHKVWTLKTRQGVCRWCGKLATCQSQRTEALRSIKSSPKRRKKQSPVNGNGYNQLDGKWLTYYQIASRFNHKAKAQDREDLLHDIMITLSIAEQNNGHKPFSQAQMYRIASVTVSHYWYRYYKVNNGLDCQHCSKAQRQKCKKDDLYRECPKAIKLESLNKPILDSEGNLTELGELIADDKALDLDAWVSDKVWQIGYPQRLVDIAYKLNGGYPLTEYDRLYLCRYRKQQQKKLIE
jgi:hypothetical protein